MTDVADYCRQLETYLCQKNGGHLVRIVGPAFERVKGWAAEGVPLKIALRGIDRCCERLQARPRRRPVRIEFCEADILDLFDDWRRAVGIAAGETAEAPSRKPGLASHIERAVQRLLGLRTGERSAEFGRGLEGIVNALDRMLEPSRHARGAERATIVAELARLDRELTTLAAGELDASESTALRSEAAAEIAPFTARMTAEARSEAIDAAFERLVREAFGLPVLVYS